MNSTIPSNLKTLSSLPVWMENTVPLFWFHASTPSLLSDTPKHGPGPKHQIKPFILLETEHNTGAAWHSAHTFCVTVFIPPLLLPGHHIGSNFYHISHPVLHTFVTDVLIGNENRSMWLEDGGLWIGHRSFVCLRPQHTNLSPVHQGAG